jgi:hypothetical protein
VVDSQQCSAFNDLAFEAEALDRSDVEISLFFGRASTHNASLAHYLPGRPVLAG